MGLDFFLAKEAPLTHEVATSLSFLKEGDPKTIMAFWGRALTEVGNIVTAADPTHRCWEPLAPTATTAHRACHHIAAFMGLLSQFDMASARCSPRRISVFPLSGTLNREVYTPEMNPYCRPAARPRFGSIIRHAF